MDHGENENEYPSFIRRLLEAFINKVKKEERENKKDLEIKELLSDLDKSKNISVDAIEKVIKQDLNT
ncbi:MAG: hypothetical protein AB8B65_11605 [Kordia sp.]|uniref:hypothetical protein n=1 Tax=Kordia sp. TaxID=1965332 RepID=UPI003859E10E